MTFTASNGLLQSRLQLPGICAGSPCGQKSNMTEMEMHLSDNTAAMMAANGPFSLKFLRRQPEFPCSINHLRWISGLGF
jgi:hypothetical protein